MRGQRFTFSVTQLLLFAVLCALVAGLVAASRYEAATSGIVAVAFSPDGRLLATRHWDGIAVWDTRRPGAWPKSRFGRAWSYPYYALHGSPFGFLDNDHLAATLFDPGSGTTLVIWDLRRDRLARNVRVPFTSPTAVKRGRPGDWLLSWSDGNKLRVWNPDQPGRVWTLDIGGSVERIAFSRDGTTLAVHVTSGKGQGGSLELWDVASRTRVASVPDVPETAEMALSPDGRQVAIRRRWKDRRAMAISHVPDQDQRTWIPAEGSASFTPLEFSPDGRLLAVIDQRGAVELRDTRTGKRVGGQITPASGQYQDFLSPAVAWSPDSRRLAVAWLDELAIWDTRTCRGLTYRSALMAPWPDT